jgi:hypothetical protein
MSETVLLLLAEVRRCPSVPDEINAAVGPGGPGMADNSCVSGPLLLKLSLNGHAISSRVKKCIFSRCGAWTTRNRNGTVTCMSSLMVDGHLKWRKSSHSIANGDCVEAASNGEIAVRDSKDPDGPILRYSVSAWQAFVANLKRGLAQTNASGWIRRAFGKSLDMNGTG